MISFRKRIRQSLSFKALSLFISLSFVSSLIVPPTPIYAQVLPSGGNFYAVNLPAPGVMVTPSPGYTPAIVQGIKIFPEDPLRFDFLIDNGDSALEGKEFEEVSIKLIKYFLASLTVPEGDLWVNLSPYEKGRIIPQNFGQTEMGRDLLAQDYVLKQLTASLMYPEDELGQKFWERVYARAHKLYGTTDIPINTFNKVWIIPDKAVVYEAEGNTALLVESHLKVMLEEDYLSINKNMDDKIRGTDQLATDDVKALSTVTSDVVRDVLIPEIEKEVNEGQNFANLRQIYQSMILAIWYKKNLRESLLGQVYVNKSKTKGVNSQNPQDKEKIYNQYLEAFKKGVYDLVKDDYDPVSDSFVPRRYISGGATVDPDVVTSVLDPRQFSPVARRNYNNMRRHTGGDAGRAIKRTAVALADLGINTDLDRVLQKTIPSSRAGDSGIAALPLITAPQGAPREIDLTKTVEKVRHIHNRLFSDLDGEKIIPIWSVLATGVYKDEDGRRIQLLDEFGTAENPKRPRIRELASKYKLPETVKENNLDENPKEANLGNLNGILDVLASFGYLEYHNFDTVGDKENPLAEPLYEDSRVQLTPTGFVAASIAQEHYTYEFWDTLNHSKNYHAYMRKEGERTTDEWKEGLPSHAEGQREAVEQARKKLIEGWTDTDGKEHDSLIEKVKKYTALVRELRSLNVRDPKDLKSVRTAGDNDTAKLVEIVTRHLGEEPHATRLLRAIVNIPTNIQTHVIQRALIDFHQHMIGLLMSPMIVALGMPDFKRKEIGKDVVYEEIEGTDILGLFRDQKGKWQDIDLNKLPKRFDPEWVRVGFELFETQGLVTLHSEPAAAKERNIVKVTDFGKIYLQRAKNYGVNNSYGRLDNRKVLRQTIFGEPDSLKIGLDGHMSVLNPKFKGDTKRAQNVWGSGGGNFNMLGLKRGMASLITGELKPEGALVFTREEFGNPKKIGHLEGEALWDELDKQPIGIDQLGVGDARIMAAEMEYIIRHTVRGKHLDTHPLIVTASDYNMASLERSKDTLHKVLNRLKVEQADYKRNVETLSRLNIELSTAGEPGDREPEEIQKDIELLEQKMKEMISDEIDLDGIHLVFLWGDISDPDQFSKEQFLPELLLMMKEKVEDRNRPGQGRIVEGIQRRKPGTDQWERWDLGKHTYKDSKHSNYFIEEEMNLTFTSKSGLLDPETRNMKDPVSMREARRKARDIILKAVQTVDRDRLYQALTMFKNPNSPTGVNYTREEIDEITWEGKDESLVDFIIHLNPQGYVDHAQRGRYVPGFVAMANKILFFQKWMEHSNHPTFMAATTRPDLKDVLRLRNINPENGTVEERVMSYEKSKELQFVPPDITNEDWFMLGEIILSPGYVGTHWVTEIINTAAQQQLAMVLGGADLGENRDGFVEMPNQQRYVQTTGLTGGNMAPTAAQLEPAAAVAAPLGDAGLAVQTMPDFEEKLQANQRVVVQEEIAQMQEDAQHVVHYYNSRTGRYESSSISRDKLEYLSNRDEIGVIQDPVDPNQYILAMKEDGAVVTSNGDLLISTSTEYPTFTDVPYGSQFFHYYSKFIPKAHQFFKFYGKEGEFNWISDILKESKVVVTAPGELGDGNLYRVDPRTRTIRIDAEFLGTLSPDELFKGDLTNFAQQRVFYGLLADAAIRIRDGDSIEPAERQALIARIAQVSKLTGSRNRLEDAMFIFNLKKEVYEEHRKLTRAEAKRFLADRLERIDFLNGRLAWQRLTEQFGWSGDLPEGELTVLLATIFAQNNKEVIQEKPTKEQLKDPLGDHDPLYFAHLQYLADHSLVEDRHAVQVFAMTGRDSGLFGNKVVIYSELQFAPGWAAELGFGTNAEDFRSSLVNNELNPGLETKLRRIESELFDTIQGDPDQRAVAIEKASRDFKAALSWDKVEKGELKIGQPLIDDIKKNLQITADMKNIPVLLLIQAVRSSAVGEDDPRRAFPGQGSSALFVWAIERMLETLGFDTSRLAEVRKAKKRLEGINRKDNPKGYERAQSNLQKAFDAAFQPLAQTLEIELPDGLSIKDSKTVTPWYELLHLILQKLSEKIESGEIKFTEEQMDELINDVYIKAWLYVQASLFNTQAINYRLLNNMSVYSRKLDREGRVEPGELVKMSTLFLPMVFNPESWLTVGINQSTGAQQMVTTATLGLNNSLVSGHASGELLASSHDGGLRNNVIPPGGSNIWEVPNPLVQGTLEIDFPAEHRGRTMFPDRNKIADVTRGQASLQRFFEAPIDSEGGFLFQRDRDGNLVPKQDEERRVSRDLLGNIIYETLAAVFQLRSETIRRWKNPFVIFQHFLRLREKDSQTLAKEGRTIAKGIAATWGVMDGEVAWINEDTTPEDLDGKIAVAFDTDPTMEHLLEQEKDDSGKVVKGIKGLITIVGSKSTHGYLYAVEQGMPYIGGIGQAAMMDLWNGRHIIGDPMDETGNGLIFDAQGLEEGKDYHIEPAGKDVDVRKLPTTEDLQGFKFGLNLDHGSVVPPAAKYWPSLYGIGLKRNERMLNALGGLPEGFLRYSNYVLYDLIDRFDRGEDLSNEEEFRLTKILERELRYVTRTWEERLAYIREKRALEATVDLSDRKNISVTINGATQTYGSARELFDQAIRDQRVARTNDPTVNDSYDPGVEKDAQEIEHFKTLTNGNLDGKDFFKRRLIPWFMEIYDGMKADPNFIRLKAEGIDNAKLRLAVREVINEYIQDNQRYPVRVAKRIKALMDGWDSEKDGEISADDQAAVNAVTGLLSITTYERLDDRSSDKVWGVPGSTVVDKGRNPFMDYRGLHLFIDNPVVLEWLLEIFVEVASDGRYAFGVFTPITNDVLNYLKFRQRMFENGLIPAEVKQGAMAESPVVGTNSREFISTMFDFWSVGSNDWVMFNLALSRFLQRQGKDHYLGFSPRNPGFTRALASLVNEMKDFNRLIRKPLGLPNVTCGFCGNWPAQDPLAGAFLKELGLDSASVTVPSLEDAAQTAKTAINNPEDLEPEDQEALAELKKEKDFNISQEIDDWARPEETNSWVTGRMSKFHTDTLPFHYQFLLELDHERFKLEKDDTPESLSTRLGIAKTRLAETEAAMAEFHRVWSETEKSLEETVEEVGETYIIFKSENLKEVKDFAKVMEFLTTEIRKESETVARLTDKKEIAEEKEKVLKYLSDQGYVVYGRDGKPLSDETLGKRGREFYQDKLTEHLEAAVLEAQERDVTAVIETAYEAPDILETNPDGSKKGMWRFYEDEITDDDLDDRGLRKLVFRKDSKGRVQNQAIRAALRSYLDLKQRYEDADITFSLAFVRDQDEVDELMDLFIQESVVDRLEAQKVVMPEQRGNIAGHQGILRRRDLTKEKRDMAYEQLTQEGILNVEEFRRETFGASRFGLGVMVPANIFKYRELFTANRHLTDVIFSKEAQRILAQFNLSADWNTPNAEIMNQPLIDLERAAYYTRNEVKLLRTAASQVRGGRGRFLYEPLIAEEELGAYKKELGMVEIPYRIPGTDDEIVMMDVPFRIPDGRAPIDRLFQGLGEKASELYNELVRRISAAPDTKAEMAEYYNSLDYLKFQTGLIKFVYEGKLLVEQVDARGAQRPRNFENFKNQLDTILDSLKGPIQLTHSLTRFAEAPAGDAGQAPRTAEELKDVKTIVLDLSGTLLIDGLNRGIGAINETYGFDNLSKLTEIFRTGDQAKKFRIDSNYSEQYWSYVLRELEDLGRAIQKKSALKLFETQDRQRKINTLKATLVRYYRPIDGVEDLLRNLRAEGYQLVVYANADAERYGKLQEQFAFLRDLPRILPPDLQASKKDADAYQKLSAYLRDNFGVTADNQVFYVDDDASFAGKAEAQGMLGLPIEKNEYFGNEADVQTLLARSGDAGQAPEVDENLAERLLAVAQPGARESLRDVLKDLGITDEAYTTRGDEKDPIGQSVAAAQVTNSQGPFYLLRNGILTDTFSLPEEQNRRSALQQVITNPDTTIIYRLPTGKGLIINTVTPDFDTELILRLQATERDDAPESLEEILTDLGVNQEAYITRGDDVDGVGDSVAQQIVDLNSGPYYVHENGKFVRGYRKDEQNFEIVLNLINNNTRIYLIPGKGLVINTVTAGDAGTVPVGGIDLNPELLDLQIRRDGNGVPLPLPQQPIHDMKIEGFLPIIINVTPVNNMPLILGAEDGEDESLDAAKDESPVSLEQLSKLSVFDVVERLKFKRYQIKISRYKMQDTNKQHITNLNNQTC